MLNEIPFPNMPVLFKNNGLDFFIIDTEHGAFDSSALSGLIMTARLCHLPVIVRLPDNTRRDVTRLVDMGVDGLLLPMTHNRQDIEPVIRFAKYAPVGQRGLSTLRSHAQYAPISLKPYMEETNARVQVFAQIESRRGLENIKDILSADGLAGVFVGPNDLACDLDCIGEKEPILRAIDTVGRAVNEAGKICGIITADEAFITQSKTSGMTMFCIGSELSMLRDGCRALAARRTNLPPASGNRGQGNRGQALDFLRPLIF